MATLGSFEYCAIPLASNQATFRANRNLWALSRRKVVGYTYSSGIYNRMMSYRQKRLINMAPLKTGLEFINLISGWFWMINQIYLKFSLQGLLIYFY